MACASICAEWAICLRHDPENPGKAPVTDRWQAASYASTRIFGSSELSVGDRVLVGGCG